MQQAHQVKLLLHFPLFSLLVSSNCVEFWISDDFHIILKTCLCCCFEFQLTCNTRKAVRLENFCVTVSGKRMKYIDYAFFFFHSRAVPHGGGIIY